MNDIELIEKLAEVMGWTLKTHTPMAFFGDKDFVWVNEKGDALFLKEDFQPLKDWNHMMMVVEKVLKDSPDHHFDIMWFPEDRTVVAELFKSDIGHIVEGCAENTDPLRAIAVALVEAVKR